MVHRLLVMHFVSYLVCARCYEHFLQVDQLDRALLLLGLALYRLDACVSLVFMMLYIE